MKKRFPLILIAFLCNFLIGFSQVTTIDFETAGAGYTPSTTYGTGNTDAFNRTNTAINGNSTYHWVAEDLATGNPTIALDQINITGATSFTFSVDLSYADDTRWDIVDQLQITYSVDGGTYQNLMWVQSIPDGDNFNAPAALDLAFDGDGDVGQEISTTAFTTFTTSAIALSSNSTLDINFRFVNLTAGGEGIFIDNIVITETIPSCSDAMDYANIQFPTSSPQTITQGDNFDVYTQAVEPGITDANASAAGVGVEAWIGYSSTNDDPSTGTGWTWIVATYNTDVGANDEHVAEIGSGLAPGTYYYASRYSLNGCDYTYGGTGGNWNNDSVQNWW